MTKSAKLSQERTNQFPLFAVTRRELVVCTAVIVSCIALHFPAVHRHFGWPIEIGLSLLSFCTPISGILYLSAAQVIPEPVMNPIITSSMMAVAGFLLWQIVHLSRSSITNCLPLLKAVAPYYFWCSSMTLLRGNISFFLTTTYAILTGCAVAALAYQSKGRFMICLLSFLVGQAIAGTVFWMVKLGLGDPVQTFDTDVYGSSSTDALRFGSGRGNATELGPSMALVVIGAIALWLMFSGGPQARSWVVRIIGASLFLVTMPPLIASGCRGAIVAVACGLVFIVFAGLVTARALLAIPVVLVACAVVFGVWWSELGLDKAWESTVEREHSQMEDDGSLVSGRQNEWKAAALGIVDSPFFGGGHIELLSYQDNPEMWASHSTYLDTGLAGGLPGMALFAWFVLVPVSRLWHRRRDVFIGCFLTVYVMNAVVISTTSAGQVKHLWMLWGLAASCMAFPLANGRISSRRWKGLWNRYPRAGDLKAVNPPALTKIDVLH
jgi:O-antigen ligase